MRESDLEKPLLGQFLQPIPKSNRDKFTFQIEMTPINKQKSLYNLNVMKKTQMEEIDLQKLRMDSILISRHRGRYILSNHPVTRTKCPPQLNYFTFDLNRLQELFDIIKIRESVSPKCDKCKSNQKCSCKQETQQFTKKCLKAQIEKLESLGGLFGLQNFLKTNVVVGLDHQNHFDLQQRQYTFGVNDKPPLTTRNLLVTFFNTLLKDAIIIIQIILCAINFDQTFDKNILLVGILVMVQVLLKAYLKQLYSKEILSHQNDIKHRNCQQPISLKVKRNSRQIEIQTEELVVGDILTFEMGDYIDCDGVLLTQAPQRISVSQPIPHVPQHDSKGIDEEDSFFNPFIYAGSQVLRGDGELLVCAIGQKASDYLYYQQTYAEQSSESQQKYLKQNSMYNPFAQKIESYIQKQIVASTIIVIIICIIHLAQYQIKMSEFQNNEPNTLQEVDTKPKIVYEDQTFIHNVLFGTLLLQLCIPSMIIQIIGLYMIKVIQTLRNQSIFVQDYLTLYWLGQINEIIMDIQPTSSLECLINSKINLRYLTRDSNEAAIQQAIQMNMCIPYDQLETVALDAGQFYQRLTNEGNKFTFISRRFAIPNIDYMKLEKIQSHKTLEWLENDQQQFEFEAFSNIAKLEQLLNQNKIISRARKADKDLLISLLKLLDRIILVTANDLDKSIQAHISVGLKDSKAALKIAEGSFSQSIYESIAQGRSVYFVIQQLSYGFAVNIFSLLNLCVFTAIFGDGRFAISNEELLVANIIQTYFSLRISLNSNHKIKNLVMQQAPYERINKLIDKVFYKQITKYLILQNILLYILYRFSDFHKYQIYVVAMIFLQHFFILIIPVRSLLLQIEVILVLFAVLFLDILLKQEMQYDQAIEIIINYSISIVIFYAYMIICY